MAIFRVWLGVRRVVTKGRLVMGLDRFFVWIQLSIASLSYEYPSVGKKSAEGNAESTGATSNKEEPIFPDLKR